MKRFDELQVIMAVGVTFAATRMLTAAFSVVYMLNQGLSLAEISSAKSFQLVMIVGLDIITGQIADRLGYVRAILISFICAALQLLCMYYLHNLAMLYVSEFFNALSLAMFSGTFVTLMKIKAAKGHPGGRLAPVFGRFTELQFYGIALSAGAGTLLADTISAKNVWLVASVLMAVQAVLVSILIPHLEATPQVTPENLSQPKVLKRVSLAFQEVKQTRNFAFAALLIAPIYETLLLFWQPLLFGQTEAAHPPKIMLGAAFLCILGVHAIAGRTLKHLHHEKPILWLTSIVMSITLASASFFFDRNRLIVFTTLVFLFFVLKLMSGYVEIGLTEALKGNNQATSQSIVSTAKRLAVAIVLWMSGHALAYIQTGTIIALLAAFMCLTFLFVFQLKPKAPGELTP